jgi:methylaspartate ammonia-lyase
MHITDVLLASGNGAFFYDDQAAIRAGARLDGSRYQGEPQTGGFAAVRVPAESLGIGLVLSDNTVVWGDMMSVQYSGASGRDMLFRSSLAAEVVRSAIVPRLLGCEVSSFQRACEVAFAPYQGKRLPLAIEYGVSQAVLHAAAHCHRVTMAEILCNEYGLPKPRSRIPLFAQSGDAREINVDKMILKSADVLPHGLFNSHDKFGKDGANFRDFVRWVVKRVGELGAPGYTPVLHFDVYGWIGLEFGLDPGRIADFIAKVADDGHGFIVNIECPADFGSLDEQVEGYASIVRALAQRGASARIVVDERCNTLGDIEVFAAANAAHLVQIKMPDVGSVADTVKGILACKKHGVGAYVGGSCTETDLSARASVHVSVATQADMMLAKPGMGVDEALSIVGNEQSRLFAEIQRRNPRPLPVGVERQSIEDSL